MTSANDRAADSSGLDRQMEFDVFVSHAYEDKESFVRPLAAALEARRLRPWYDEFTLRPGDSLRRSIDHGLLTSQAGIVILSPAFFGKRWTNYELDGLIQLNAGAPEQVAGSGSGGRLIPIWHKVDAEAVAHYSPSLANLVALRSSEGIEAVADRILALLRPTGSALLFAYEELSEQGKPLGWYPPVVTDDWWLDVVEASAKSDAETAWVSDEKRIVPFGVRARPNAKPCKGHWAFPLPEHSSEPRARGHRLARVAAQIVWQRANENRKICQITPPDEVLDFIKNCPGLAEACVENPSYALSYVPQLALPGAASWLQETVDAAGTRARDKLREVQIDPDSESGRERLMTKYGYLVLSDIELVKADPEWAAYVWIEGAFSRLPTRVYEICDYAGWLLSDSSHWLGEELCFLLLGGIAKWGAWPTLKEAWNYPYSQRRKEASEASHAMKKIRSSIVRYFSGTVRKLRLAESSGELADRLLATSYFEIFGFYHFKRGSW